MRRMLVVSGAGLLVLAGCAGDSDSAVSVTSIAAATTATAPATSTTVAPTTTESVPTTTAATTPASSTTEPAAPAPTDPPATDPPATTPPAATPAPTDPPVSETPIATGPTPLSPAFLAFDVSAVGACPATDVSVPLEPREVTVSWEVIGAESVYVAIDNVDGPYATGLPPAGSITLPHNCPDGNTYYVVAENPEGRTVSEATR